MFKLKEQIANCYFDIQFKNGISLIVGDSATGKTFMFKQLSKYCSWKKIPCVLYNHSICDKSIGYIKNMYNEEKPKLVFVDNADIILNESFVEFLKQLPNDTSIIISIKRQYGLRLEPCQYLDIHYDGKTLTTEYRQI